MSLVPYTGSETSYILQEQHFNSISCQLPSEGLCLSAVYQVIESAREALNIEVR